VAGGAANGAMSCTSLSEAACWFVAALCAGSFAEGETARVLPKAKLQKRRALLNRLHRLFVILSFAKNLVFVPTRQG